MLLLDIHICEKTCNVCGLIYVCKTQQDPYMYEGSGTEWKIHNQKCKINHSTKILFSSSNKQEVKEFCEKYGKETNPNYWKTPEYANMIMEGGGYNNTGEANPNYKNGRAVGWKSNPKVQKENDKLRNSEYHKKNIDVERTRMRAVWHRNKGNISRAISEFNLWQKLRCKIGKSEYNLNEWLNYKNVIT